MKSQQTQSTKSAPVEVAYALSQEISNTPHPIESLFEDTQKLLSFEISFLKQEHLKRYCEQYDLNADQTEIVLMQANGVTDCHLHTKGHSTFITLGEAHGFPEPGDSGLLSADYEEGIDTYDLTAETFGVNEISEVRPMQIHAFYAGEGHTLTALGVVSPKIRHDKNEFDVVDYDYIGERKVRQVA